MLACFDFDSLLFCQISPAHGLVLGDPCVETGRGCASHPGSLPFKWNAYGEGEIVPQAAPSSSSPTALGSSREREKRSFHPFLLMIDISFPTSNQYNWKLKTHHFLKKVEKLSFGESLPDNATWTEWIFPSVKH